MNAPHVSHFSVPPRADRIVGCARCAGLVVMIVSLLTAAVRADVVFAWNEFLLHTAAHSDRPAWLTTRAFAIAHTAMADAVAATGGSAANADELRSEQRAAAVAAAHDVIVALLPEAVAAGDALESRHLAAIGDTAARRRGESTGRHAAAVALQDRAADGWVEVAERAAAIPLDLAGSEPRVLPSPYLSARPFALRKLDQFTVAETRTLQGDGTVVPNTALLHSRLFRDLERGNGGAALDPGSVGPWAAETPLVRWNRIARQAAATRPLDLREEAQLLRTLNRTLADATLVALHARSTVGSWRIVAALGWQQLDEVPPVAGDVVARVINAHEFEWVRRDTVHVALPPTPDYPSVAATLAGAARAAIAATLGAEDPAVTLPAALGVAADACSWKLTSVAKQAAYTASLDGRHSREGCIAGYQLGESIGRYIAQRAHR